MGAAINNQIRSPFLSNARDRTVENGGRAKNDWHAVFEYYLSLN